MSAEGLSVHNLREIIRLYAQGLSGRAIGRSLLKNARMRQQACIEDLRFGGERGLTKAMLKPLAGARWVTAHENVIISGATGVGKSYVACALGNQACREGHTVMYRRARRLFDELMTARADGSAQKLLAKLARANVLIIDDFGTESLDVRERSDLLEIVEDRYQVGSTVFTSQRDPSEWHGVIGDETIGTRSVTGSSTTGTASNWADHLSGRHTMA